MKLFGKLKDDAAVAAKARTQAIIKSGYAGIHPELGIVDRRDHPSAVPVEESAVLGAPAPKELRV